MLRGRPLLVSTTMGVHHPSSGDRSHLTATLVSSCRRFSESQLAVSTEIEYALAVPMTTTFPGVQEAVQKKSGSGGKESARPPQCVSQTSSHYRENASLSNTSSRAVSQVARRTAKRASSFSFERQEFCGRLAGVGYSLDEMGLTAGILPSRRSCARVSQLPYRRSRRYR